MKKRKKKIKKIAKISKISKASKSNKSTKVEKNTNRKFVKQNHFKSNEEKVEIKK